MGSRSLVCLLASTLFLTAPTMADVQTDWVTRVDEGGRHDEGVFAAFDAAGNVIIAGTSRTASDEEVLVVKHDPRGTPLWTRRIPSGSGGEFGPRGLAVDSSGNVLVTCLDYFPSLQDSRVVTVQLDPQGSETWRRILDNPGAVDRPVGMVLDDAGGPIVAGNSSSNAFIVAYTPEGNLAWQDTIDNGNGRRDDEGVYDLARDPVSGATYVSGVIFGPNAGVLLLRYDADGRRRWVKRYPVRNVFTIGEAVAVDPSGNLLVAGYYQPVNSDIDIQVLKINSDGRLMWSALYATPGKDDRVVDLATDGAGDAFIAATIFGISADVDRLVLKYLPNGTRDWAAVHDRAGQYDDATALAVDPAGNSYVAGTSATLNGTSFVLDWATSRYDSSGALVWTAFYDGNPVTVGGDSPADVVLGPSSKVVVTGVHQGDAVTIEYGQP